MDFHTTFAGRCSRVLGNILIRCQGVVAASIPGDVTEAPPCRESEFRCKNGACVASLSRCNGSTECADSSDETFVLCRNDQCGQNQFRCAYGACVVGGACDGVQHCADNSDEQLSRCLPEQNRTTDCENGQLLADENKCDGKVDCADASDETLARCGDVSCGNEKFKCAYGGCAHKLAKCNGVTDCADGSDESDELCDKKLRIDPRAGDQPTTIGPQDYTCVLPAQPENGAYIKFVDPETVPEDHPNFVVLNFTCYEPYKLIGKQFVICNNGRWANEFPTCQAVCRLPRSLRTQYRCLLSGNSSIKGYKECGWMVPRGTEVQPVCRFNFYSPEELRIMTCSNGKWNYIPKCIPECGRLFPKGTPLMAGGQPAKRGELPWHAGIYSKEKSPYEQICGGTIISKKVIISAAHCFWEAGSPQLPCKYAAAAGKLYRAWKDPQDDKVQRRNNVIATAAYSAQQRRYTLASNRVKVICTCFCKHRGRTAKSRQPQQHPEDVIILYPQSVAFMKKLVVKIIDLKIPPRYRGVLTSFQDDIALVVLDKGLEFIMLVKPICIDFEYDFDARQLQPGNMGKVAGWGYTSEAGEPSSFLKVANLPSVSVEQCYNDTPFGFTTYITTDKICAGYKNGTATVCRGDSGGGLAFPEVANDVTRYYLRGVVSTAPADGLKCNTITITTFTHVLSHKDFIKTHFVNFTESGFQYFDSRKVTFYNGTLGC